MSAANSVLSLKTTWKNDIRRIKVDGDAPDAFDRLLKQVVVLYKQPANTKFIVKYVDDEQEQITISSSEELVEACRIAGADNRKSLKLFLEKVDDEDDQEFVQVTEDHDDTSSIATGVTGVTVDSSVQSPSADSSLFAGPAPTTPATTTVLSKDALNAFASVKTPAPQETPAAARKDEVITITYPTDYRNIDYKAPVEVPVTKPAPVEQEVAAQAVPVAETKEEQATPATPAPEVPQFSLDTVIALLIDFHQQPWAQEEVSAACEIAMQGFLASKPIMDVVTEILSQRPKIAESQLVTYLVPFLPLICASAQCLGLCRRKQAKIIHFLPQLFKACKPEYMAQILKNVAKGNMANFENIENDEIVIDVHSNAAPAEEAVEEEDQINGQWVHRGVMCDMCEMNPIVGSRFKCTVCSNYDLCEGCEAKGEHPAAHVLMKIRQPVRRGCGFGAWRSSWRHGHGHAHGHGHGRPCGQAPKAEFVADKTIPDRSAVVPGCNLMKVWQIKNIGPQAWPEGVELTFLNGTVVPVQGSGYTAPVTSAQPGEIVDISVEVTCPAAPGRHVGNFRLRGPNGHYFGDRFWVMVDVVDESIVAAQKEALAAAERARIAAELEAAEREAKEQAEKAAQAEAERLAKEQAEKEAKEQAEKEALKQSKLQGFKYLNELNHLEALGFNDIDLNMYMLLNHKGDLQRVVDWLLENTQQ